MPHQLRSSAHVFGLPDLLPKDRAAADLGNSLLVASMRELTCEPIESADRSRRAFLC